MKGIILAAGVSSRMRPLTNNTPKCLLPIGDQNILQRTIDNLIDNSINDILIVTGYLNNQIEDFVKKAFPTLNVNFIHNDIYDSTNNIYSLWLTKDKALNNDILLLDSDIVFDKNIIKLLLSSDHQNCLALKSAMDLGEEEMKLKTNSDGSIYEISKTLIPAEAIGESIGIEKFSKNLVNPLFRILDEMVIAQKQDNVFYEKAFQIAINEGKKIFPIDVDKLKCMEIDTIEDYELAQQIILSE